MKTMINNSATRLNSFGFVFFAAAFAENNFFNSFRISTGTFAFTMLASVISFLFLFGKLRKIKAVNNTSRETDELRINK